MNQSHPTNSNKQHGTADMIRVEIGFNSECELAGGTAAHSTILNRGCSPVFVFGNRSSIFFSVLLLKSAASHFHFPLPTHTKTK